MEKKLDFRVQRTYQMLMSALMSLLQEKSFDEITVGELCERAVIRRATFYKHFADKYELFTFSIRELQRHFSAETHIIYDKSHPKSFYAAPNYHLVIFLCGIALIVYFAIYYFYHIHYNFNNRFRYSSVPVLAGPVLFALIRSQLQQFAAKEGLNHEKESPVLSGLRIPYFGSIATGFCLQSSVCRRL